MSGNIDQTHEHHVVANHSDYYEHRSVDDGMMEEYSEKPPPPQKRPFYKKKKYWIICSVLSAIIIVVVVCLAVFVFFPMIAQSLMNQAGIDVNAADITFSKPAALDGTVYSKRDGDNLNTTFYMNMQSTLKNTGPFSAKIKFHNPVDVYYNDTLLGNIYLFNDSSISGGHGELNAITPFMIQDQNAFAAFAKEMLAVESFVWTLKGKLDITALTRTATVDLNKDINLKGMNGFPDVKINSFQLPGNDPNGGILVELGTVLNSPSPIGVQLGTIRLAVGYEGVALGTVQAENVNLAGGENNLLLKGTLVPQTDNASLAKVGNLFSNYVSGKFSNTTATGLSAAPDGVNSVSWLSDGFKTVQLNVALGVAEPLKIITGVSMGYLDLKFDPNNPYSPSVTAPQVKADFNIPFGFTLNITDVTQNITLGINQTTDKTDNFAIINVPMTPAVSDQQAGLLTFPLNNGAIAGIGGQEKVFDAYTFALTASDNYTFMVAGQASTKTKTPIGDINLSGITFNLPTSLKGLQFLNSSATIINSLDVTGGTAENLILSINVTMTNPADFSISTGDVSFLMGSNGTDLGVVTLGNLSLARGDNQKIASATFDPKSSDVGQNLLSSFVMGADNSVSISGYQNSTNIASLAGALGAVSLGSTLPGLKTALIQGASIVVSDDTPKTGIVGTKVSLANPFSAGLAITSVVASATYQGMPVGNIDQDISSNPFSVSGKTTGESNSLDMKMNIEPASVALLLRTLAVQGGLETKALDALLGLGGFHIDGQEDVTADASVFQGFNISQYVMQAMQSLAVDLQLKSSLVIGQYEDDLSFSQAGIKVKTDDTITKLIPIVGQPIVQQIVDGAVLAFETIILSAPTDSQFTVQMKGSITKAGPLDAAISFPVPLNVAWKGTKLGEVQMPTIQSKADVGANFDVTGTFTIVSGDGMAKFAAYMINNQDFVWDISTNGVAVNALGFTFTNVSMVKAVTLAGCNGFKDAVTIKSFDLPSDDPAGGITLIAETTISNPSQVGFNLAGVSFEAYFSQVDLGPLASNGAAVFPPKGTADISMKGRLIPQDSAGGLQAVTEVFENYLTAKDSALTVKGVSGSGPNGVVGWLSTAFKTLAIQNVILPGPATPPKLIPAITMKDMNLDFTKDPWAPPTGSNNVQAQVKNPFGFPLRVSKLNMDAEATYNGLKVASLTLPDEDATTDANGLVTTQFKDVPFKVANHELFSAFVKLLTLSPSVTFGLEGSTNTIATTAIGSLSLKNITFDVNTTLGGLNDFGGTVKLESVEISGATKEYVIADISFQLVNPSNITITVGDINFDVIMNEFNTKVGRVYVKDAIIAPGANSLKGELHLGEDVTNDKAIGQTFSDYLTSAKIPLTISGSKDSTAIPPLVDAFSSVKLSTEMAGIAGNLIETIAVKGTIIGLLFENKANAVITLKNPLGAPFSITDVDASVTFTPSSGGSKFNVGTIKYTPSPVTTVPAKGSATTGEWPVDLVKGQLLQLIGMVLDSHKVLDVQQNVTVNVGDGYKTSMFYYQDQVPFTISIDGLDLTGLSIPSSLSSNALSQGLTTLSSSMDDSTANNVLRNILSGNTKNVTSSASGSSSATTTTGGGLLGGLLPSKTDSSSSTTAEAKSNPTENSKSETTTAAQATTTTKERAFSLPFGL